MYGVARRPRSYTRREDNPFRYLSHTHTKALTDANSELARTVKEIHLFTSKG